MFPVLLMKMLRFVQLTLHSHGRSCCCSTAPASKELGSTTGEGSEKQNQPGSRFLRHSVMRLITAPAQPGNPTTATLATHNQPAEVLVSALPVPSCCLPSCPTKASCFHQEESWNEEMNWWDINLSVHGGLVFV